MSPFISTYFCVFPNNILVIQFLDILGCFMLFFFFSSPTPCFMLFCCNCQHNFFHWCLAINNCLYIGKLSITLGILLNFTLFGGGPYLVLHLFLKYVLVIKFSVRKCSQFPLIIYFIVLKHQLMETMTLSSQYTNTNANSCLISLYFFKKIFLHEFGRYLSGILILTTMKPVFFQINLLLFIW